eukprot:CAMPEP_0198112106 /NCGR_PEP_ID=MMETSP1442-20131203/4009_1 /TAXON_ID= /ORGANISM="Craspedostauros australis, Strain CCMP3328" /LENGTH=35 /DNA_ID= /DNA_START= /DNA_END= /DNA_ORIENTATION=
MVTAAMTETATTALAVMGRHEWIASACNSGGAKLH